MSSLKPAIVIVPGAWHPASCYDGLANQLKAADFTVLTATLPSLNPPNPLTATCTEDAKAVRKVILSLLDVGKDVVLVNHSYGGVPGNCAARGLSKATYGKPGVGGVIGIIHMASFVVPGGTSLVDFGGGTHPPYILVNQPSAGLSAIASPTAVFFDDVDNETALALEKSLQPHAIIAFESLASPAAWQEPEFQGRLAFLRCVQDKALPVFVQDMFIEKSHVKWLVKDIEAGHSAYASQPKEVAEILKEWATVFSKGK